MLTLDNAAIASGNAFLMSELEKRDPIIRKPLTSVTYPRDIVIQSGGGWVDTISAMSVSYGITGGSGSALVSAGSANTSNIIQQNFEKGDFKAHPFTSTLFVSFFDMQKSNFIGRSLDKLLSDGVRLSYDKHLDENVYVGLEKYGTTGLVNNKEVAQTKVKAGAAGATEWSKKTPKEILNDVNTAILEVWNACGNDESAIPNHILLPYEQYNHILSTMVTDLAAETIMDYILKNNVAAKNNKSLFIGATKWCKGVGTSSGDRMVVYVNHENFVKMDELVPLTRSMSQPNARQQGYDTLYTANISEVEIFYNQSLGYFDGI